MTDETDARIREVLEEHGRLSVPVAGLGDTDDLYDAGMTSHACVSVMLAVEDFFDVEFPQETLQKSTFASIAAIRGIVDRLRADGDEGGDTATDTTFTGMAGETGSPASTAA